MSVGPAPKRHARALSPETLVVSLLMAALSAVICMQIISRIGITPNTSIIGAILAMGLARIPLDGVHRCLLHTPRSPSRLRCGRRLPARDERIQSFAETFSLSHT